MKNQKLNIKDQLLKGIKEELNSIPKKKKIVWGVSAFLLIGLIGGILDGPEESKEVENADKIEAVEVIEDVKPEPEAEADAEIEAVEPEPEAEVVELTFEEQVEAIAKKVGGDRLKTVDIAGEFIVIELDMSENFTNNLMVGGMKRDAFSIFEKVQPLTEENEIKDVTVIFKAPFIDKYGNETVEDAGMFTMDVEELVKINFDNMTTDRIENLCSVSWVHPAFTK